MPENFHFMTLQNLTDREIVVSFPPDDTSNWQAPPLFSADGKINLVFFQPTDDQRHLALGKYIDAWSNLELRLKAFVCAIFQMEVEALTAMLSALGTRGMLDVLHAHAFQGLTEASRKELERLLECVKENNTRRNHIIHGLWMLEWVVRQHGEKVVARCVQYRMYLPSNEESREAIKHYHNRKERLKYMFTVRRVEALTKALIKLAADVGNFRLKHLPLQGKALQKPV